MRSDNMPRPFAPEHGEEAASQLQRDIDIIDGLFAPHPTNIHNPATVAAWQRIRARLTPNRERVARAIRDVMIYHTGDESSLREKLTDAAIDAMKETP